MNILIALALFILSFGFATWVGHEAIKSFLDGWFALMSIASGVGGCWIIAIVIDDYV